VVDAASDPHQRFELGLYVLGVLGPRERKPIERHLAACDECRLEAETLGEVVAALALFSAQERREIVAEFGLPLAATAHAVGPRPHTGRPQTGRPQTGRAQTGPAMTARAPSRWRLDLSDRRTRGMLSIAGLTAVVILFVGIFIGGTLNGQGGGAGGKPVDFTLAATAVDARTGASVSVRVTGHDDGTVSIRATVTGLHDGTQYWLYAVTSDGATHRVTGWIGSAAPQDIGGDLPVPIGDLSFFTVTFVDDAPVVSAYLSRSASPSPTA
jgi:hypothetical protein